LHPVFGVSGRTIVVASAAALVGASKALKQNAHSYGGIPASGIQSIRVHLPASDRLIVSFCAIKKRRVVSHITMPIVGLRRNQLSRRRSPSEISLVHGA
jgi:hypothetical protein